MVSGMLRFILGIFKSTVSLVFAAVLLTLLVTLMVSGVVGGLFAPQPIEYKEESFLVVDLSASIVDKPPEQLDPRELVEEAVFSDGDGQVIILPELLATLEFAARDSKIAGIYLTGTLLPGGGTGNSLATLREVRDALQTFTEESGKPVVAYLDNPSQGDLFVTSASGNLWLHPNSIVPVTGLASSRVFLDGLLEKYGIGVQVVKSGEYKDAVELFTRQEMSEPSREQAKALLADLWSSISRAISEKRELAPEKVQELAAEMPLLSGKKAVENALADKLMHKAEVIERVADIGSWHESKEQTKGARTFAQISYEKLNRLRLQREAKASKAARSIAVIYAEGSIVNAPSPGEFIVAQRLTRRLREVREDESIGGVVLRVNSPGGSSFAAESIRHEVSLTAREKPLVVSMGGAAASGGYWISAPAQRIFASAETITGSIGVFGLLPNIRELANGQGITFDAVRTGPFADLGSIAREKSDKEMEMIQEIVDADYEQFISIVAEGRGMSPEEVRKLAGGRVWSGRAAAENGLVDELGGLRDAIAYLVEKLGYGVDYEMRQFPEPKTGAELLKSIFAGEEKPAAGPGMRAGLSRQIISRARNVARELHAYDDPRGVYARLPWHVEW
jgi:protease-4